MYYAGPWGVHGRIYRYLVEGQKSWPQISYSMQGKMVGCKMRLKQLKRDSVQPWHLYEEQYWAKVRSLQASISGKAERPFHCRMKKMNCRNTDLCCLIAELQIQVLYVGVDSLGDNSLGYQVGRSGSILSHSVWWFLRELSSHTLYLEVK